MRLWPAIVLFAWGMLAAIKCHAMELTYNGHKVHTMRVAKISGEINATSASMTIGQLIVQKFMSGDQVLIIDSPGGFVDFGVAIIEEIEDIKARGTKVIGIVQGEASSMAFNILTHCDVRLATKDSTLMFHHLFYMPEDFIKMVKEDRATAEHLRIWAKSLDEDERIFTKDNMKALHMSLRKYKKYADEQKEWKPKELVKNGYLSAIIRFK